MKASGVMRKEIMQYAIQGLKNKKRTTIPAFFVLCISFSFLIFATSLIGSISKTNDEFRINTYGDWYIDILGATAQDKAWAGEQTWVSASGCSYNYGMVCGEKKVGIGSVDSEFIAIGRLSLNEGKWPENENEVAMEADTLSSLGYDYTLGQSVTLDIELPISETDSLNIQKEYILTGIIHEYTDLWTIESYGEPYYLNSIVITQKASELLEDELNQTLEEEEKVSLKPEIQLFLQVPEEYRDGVEDQVNMLTVAYNQCAYDIVKSADANQMYIVIILMITMVAIWFTYILQINNQVHSFSIMRSVGMTKVQLARLIVYETMFLCIPAVILGIGTGSCAIVLVLKALVYGGSVPIIVDVSWKVLSIEIILWFFTVLFSRMLVYVVAVKAPLSGHMNLRRNQRRALLLLRRFCVAVLCICFGVIVIYTGIMSIRLNDRREFISSCPSYVLDPEHFDKFGQEITPRNMTGNDMSNIIAIPGVHSAYGFSEYAIEYPFETDEECSPYLYVINDEDWNDIFSFQKNNINMEDFRNGKTVILCFPEEERNQYEKNISTVQFSFSTISGEEISDIKADIGGVLYISDDINTILAGFTNPYTLLCSEQFVLHYGIEGYTRIHVDTNFSIENASTDFTMAEYCKKNNIFLSNRREKYWAYRQECVQSLIMLFSIGISVGLIFFLLLCCILSLEKEHQTRSYNILRTIGMSKAQWRLRSLGVSCARGLSAATGGWIVFLAMLNIRGSSFSSICGGWNYSNVNEVGIFVSILAFAVPAAISLGLCRRKD